MTARELSEQLKKDDYADRFLEIYRSADAPKRQKKRCINAIAAFTDSYGEGEIGIFSAPGRTEVGGNHTDHQHGEVLAASINKDAIAIVKKTEGNEVSVISGSAPRVNVSIGDLSLKIREEGKTIALIRGVLAGLQKRGYKVGGFQAYITSDVLIGAGLSSSAAFETLIGTIESELYNDGKVSATEIAMIGQYAENIYFGKPCGLMDQMACSVGSLVHIDFQDPEKPKTKKIEFDFSAQGYGLCIVDTKGSHSDLTPDYAAVPAEMKSIASQFGKDVLRDVSEALILENLPKLRKKNGDRAVLRALHYYEENKRVRREVQALKDNDLPAFLNAVRASGASSFQYLQNVYTTHDITHQNVSLALQLSELVLSQKCKCTPENFAVRVHGGGFAGTIQAWIPLKHIETYRKYMDEYLGEHACDVLNIRAFGGIRVI